MMRIKAFFLRVLTVSVVLTVPKLYRILIRSLKSRLLISERIFYLTRSWEPGESDLPQEYRRLNITHALIRRITTKPMQMRMSLNM